VGSARILVADADRRAAGVLSWLLAEQGFDASVAHPPRAVDQTLRWRVPDLLLIDTEDPDLAGIVKRVRRDERFGGMRIIAATGAGAKVALQVPDGADDYVGKPYRPVEVLIRVRAQLRAAEELAKARVAFETLESTIADNRRLEELATTDALTGLLNRRALADRLATEMDRAQRYASDLAILMIDIDYFKRVNDTAGHLAGDEVLRGMAGRIQNAVRTVDIAARYGGEEFVVILPETALLGATTFAERLRLGIAAHEFTGSGGNFRLTVSIGISTFPAADIASADELIARADAAMYRAKENGRDQVRS
jgi:diguanylate cyclase (GGDEF)-like protein